MENKLKSMLTTLAFTLLLGGVFLLNCIVPDPDVLQSERRKPAARPALSAQSLLSAEFMDGFGKYAADNLVFRDAFRTLRAVCVFDVFMQSDKAGLYYDKNVGAGKFEKLDKKSAAQAADKIKKLSERFSGPNQYYAIIPDKSVYASTDYPGFDPGAARKIFEERLDGLTYIDLTGALRAGDFYRTDLHWNQAEIGGVPEALGAVMGFDPLPVPEQTNNRAGDFRGVYAGQLALPLKPDSMTYVTTGAVNAAVVRYLDPATGQMTPGPMYDAAAAGGRDPYDLFLKGTQPLITIENPEDQTGRRLCLFRDSFGSSLAPLLTPYYAKITLIDIRYIDARVLDTYIDFTETNADVLFLYGSQILNNAGVLLVN